MSKTGLFEKLQEINTQTCKQTKKPSSNGTHKKSSVMSALGSIFLTADKTVCCILPTKVKRNIRVSNQIMPYIYRNILVRNH